MTVDTAALPPWASPKAAALAAPSAGVPSLQALLCHWLAKNLHVIEALDDLPPHLADLVRTEIRADRSLLRDDAVAVWLEAIDFDARHLSLRWASNLTDAGLFTIAAHTQLTQGLVSLDLGYCESVGDAGMRPLCPCFSRKSEQSLPLHVLIVELAVSPLHIVTGTDAPAAASARAAIAPHHAT